MIPEQYYDLVDWLEIQRKSRNNILVVNIDEDSRQHQDITHQFKKENLLVVDTFFTYDMDDESTIKSVTENKITERYIDELGNLILFVKSRLTHV